jgi:hypothetical protein
MYINIKNALHVSTLKGSLSGAKSNKLTTHIQRYIRSQNSNKHYTIIYTEAGLKIKMIIKCNAQSEINKGTYEIFKKKILI